MKNEQGSVLLWILVAVVLLAGLTAAMNQGSRTSTGMVDGQQARLVATEIISYGDSIAQGVQRLQLKGCSEQEIDFSDHRGTSKQVNGEEQEYNNPHKRDDGSCGLFHTNGAGVAPILLSAGYISPSLVDGNWMHPQSSWFVQHAVKGVGTDGLDGSGTDLVVIIGRLQKLVCIEINNVLGVNNPSGEPPLRAATASVGGDDFEGVFSSVANLVGDGSPAVVGKNAFCAQTLSPSSGEDQFVYHRVLIAR